MVLPGQKSIGNVEFGEIIRNIEEKVLWSIDLYRKGHGLFWSFTM
jgi:hypothetical protein